MSADWTELRESSGGGLLSDTEAASRSWLDRYIRDADQAEVRSVVEQAVAARSTLELEHRVRHAAACDAGGVFVLCECATFGRL